MPWQKGKSGNPSGRPKRDAEVASLAREHGAAAIAKLAKLLESDDARIVVAAASELLDRGYGRAPQTLNVTHDPLDGLTTDEKRAFIAALDALAASEADAAQPVTGATH